MPPKKLTNDEMNEVVVEAKAAVAHLKELNESSTVLYDETFELRDGKTFRMIVDMATILTKVNEYTQALSDARGLPFDLDNLSARDRIVRWLVAQYEDKIKAKVISEGDILIRAQNYYQRALADAQTGAHLLAFFDSDENVFDNVPTPYEKETSNGARFVEPMPGIEKNLAFPIEYALKQIYDVLTSNPAVIGRVMQIANELSVRVNRVVSAGGLVETDENGFHPGPVDGAVS